MTLRPCPFGFLGAGVSGSRLGGPARGLALQPRLESAVFPWMICTVAYFSTPDIDTSANTGADSSIDADTSIDEPISMSLAVCSRLPGDINVAWNFERSA